MKMKLAGVMTAASILLIGVTPMTAFALNGYIIQMDMTDMKEILRLLKINSNNLNQYVKKANETGNIYYEDIMELKKSQSEILQRMGCVLDRLSGIS